MSDIDLPTTDENLERTGIMMTPEMEAELDAKESAAKAKRENEARDTEIEALPSNLDEQIRSVQRVTHGEFESKDLEEIQTEINRLEEQSKWEELQRPPNADAIALIDAQMDTLEDLKKEKMAINEAQKTAEDLAA